MKTTDLNRINSISPNLMLLIPDMEIGPEDPHPRELSEARKDTLLNALDDIALILEILDRHVLENSAVLSSPDRLVLRSLGLSRRIATSLVEDFSDTAIWRRLLRLHGLVCAAQIIADTSDLAKDSASPGAETPALDNTIGAALGLAKFLLCEAEGDWHETVQ